VTVPSYTGPMPESNGVAMNPLFGEPMWVTRMRVAAEAAGREVWALAQQSLLMHRDLRTPNHVRSEPHRDLVVVLHGLFATAGALRPLRRRIERGTGALTTSFTYEPGCRVPSLARRLEKLLSVVPQKTPIHLVGHSLGGLVARYYVQVEPRDSRVVQTISLASPFQGTTIARFLPRAIASDIEPGSELLGRVAASWHQAPSVPHTSIVATHDHLVRPSWSAASPHGEVVILLARGHNTLLFDPLASQHVVRCISRHRTNPPHPM
jgi:pimeloyl-ACP methyl ester carboxylesterase